MYGIVSDIYHSNLVIICGVSKNVPMVDFVHYDSQLTVLERKIKGGVPSDHTKIWPFIPWGVYDSVDFMF